MSDIGNIFADNKKEIPVSYNGKDFIFTAHELGYLEVQMIAAKARASGQSVLVEVVAASIKAPGGEKFTVEEVLKMKREFAEPFFDAVVELHGLNSQDDDKKK